MIGIIGAMEIELDSLILNLEDKVIKKIEFLDFYIGKLYKKEVVIVKSNEGKVNSGIATQLLISNFDITYIINVGVAGSLSEKLDIYDVAISKNTVEFDQDVTALGYEKGYTFGLDTVYVKACDDLCEKFGLVCKKLKFNYLVGTILSSDKFVTDINEKLSLKEKFDGIAVDMESASINHVAKLNNIPFIALRIISDNGNNVQYKTFANKAADNISRVLKEYFEEVVI